MPSLLDKVAAAEWRANWPAFAAVETPAPHASRVARLLASRGAVDNAGAVPVSEVLAAIRDLEAWNSAAERWLTVPPTMRGFGIALLQLPKHPGTALIEAAWPQLAAHAREAFLHSQPASAQPAAPAPPPAQPVASAQTSSSGDPAARRAAQATGKERPRPQRPQRPSPAATATAEAMLALAAADPDAPPAVRRERFGSLLRDKVLSGAGKAWFEEALVPALAAVPTRAQLRDLAKVWPEGMSFSPQDPVGWLKGPALWHPLRVAAPEVRDALMGEWLPWLVDSKAWTPTQRLAAFKFMVGWVKTDEALLEQRVNLWRAWGGDLHERCGEWGREEDAFASGSGKDLSAIEWLASQGVPMWTAWAAKATAPPVQATPARRPSP